MAPSYAAPPTISGAYGGYDQRRCGRGGMADTMALGAIARKSVGVRLPPPALHPSERALSRLSGLDIRSAPPGTAIASARTVVRDPPGVSGRRPRLPARPASHTHPERTASVVDMPGTAPWRPRRRPSSIGLDRAHTRRLAPSLPSKVARKRTICLYCMSDTAILSTAPNERAYHIGV